MIAADQQRQPMATNGVPDRMINVEQLADFLRVTRGTIYRMIRDGKLPQSNRFGKGHQWLESELQKHFSTKRPIAN
jgi:excisionase family DNA binding protein